MRAVPALQSPSKPTSFPVVLRVVLAAAVAGTCSISGPSRAAPAGDATPSAAAPSATASVRAYRLDGSINVDGVLSESQWQVEPSISDLTQSEPTEGAPPTQGTEVRIAYDANALYVAARMSDSRPDSIVANLWPGSSLFFVWTRERSDQDGLGDLRLSGSMQPAARSARQRHLHGQGHLRHRPVIANRPGPKRTVIEGVVP